MAWRVVEGGVILSVRVTPRASREAVEAVVDIGDGRQALAIRVRSAPSDGAANEAVVGLLARELKLPQRAVTLVSGMGARLKQVRLDGPADEIAQNGRAHV